MTSASARLRAVSGGAAFALRPGEGLRVPARVRGGLREPGDVAALAAAVGDGELVVPVIGEGRRRGEHRAGVGVEGRAGLGRERVDLRALAAHGALLHELALEREHVALGGDGRGDALRAAIVDAVRDHRCEVHAGLSRRSL